MVRVAFVLFSRVSFLLLFFHIVSQTDGDCHGIDIILIELDVYHRSVVSNGRGTLTIIMFSPDPRVSCPSTALLRFS